MSATTTTPLPTQDLAAQIRDAAVASLLAYGTLAGANVERERFDPVESGDMPRLIIFADDTATVASAAGTAPAFDVTMTLMVDALTERAARDDAVADIDALVAQVKDCLLGDASWVALSQSVTGVAVTRLFKPQDQMIVGAARIRMTMTWRELYPPRVVQPLATIDITLGSPPAPPAPPPPPTTIVNPTVAL